MCDEPCTPGTYGDNCKNVCDCKNGANCHPTNGSCICPVGYMGPKCGETCPHGFWGKTCQTKCNCLNDASCSVSTGVCICAQGYSGKMCERRSKTFRLLLQRITIIFCIPNLVCPDDKYGANCTYNCECNKDFTDK